MQVATQRKDWGEAGASFKGAVMGRNAGKGGVEILGNVGKTRFAEIERGV